jgi:GxxExxY protein
MRAPFDSSKMGLPPVPQEWNVLTSRVIDAAMEVHTILGPGLLEGVYEDALCYEFGLRNISFERQLTFPIRYKGQPLRDQRCDLLVDGLVVVELKSTDGVDEVYLNTMLGYMRALDVPLGLLLNFNEAHLRDGLHRRVNSRSSRMPPTPVLVSSSLSPQTPLRTPA